MCLTWKYNLIVRLGKRYVVVAFIPYLNGVVCTMYLLQTNFMKLGVLKASKIHTNDLCK